MAISVFFGIREIHATESPFAAGFFLFLLFFYVRFLLGKTMSEMIGLPLGLLAFFFLHRSAREKKAGIFLPGILLLTLALNARAGAFFILPAIILWSGFTFCSNNHINWRLMLFALIVVVLGFSLNFLVFHYVSAPGSTPFGNFSYTLYGITRGGQSWTLIFEEHPEINSLPTSEIYNYVYHISFENIKNHPLDLIKGLIHSYSVFFSLDDYYGSLCWFGSGNLIGDIAKILFYLLMAMGTVIGVKKRSDPRMSLLVAAFMGIVLSISLLPPSDSNRMRAYAATIPFFLAIPVIAVGAISRRVPWINKFFPKIQPPAINTAGIFTLCVLLLMTVFPIGLNSFTKPAEIDRFECAQGLKPIVFRLLPGNHIFIHDQGSLAGNWLPDIQKKDFIRLVHDLPNWELFPVLTGLKENQVLISDLNLIDMDEMILIADRDKIDRNSELQTACGIHQDIEELKVYNVYIAD